MQAPRESRDEPYPYPARGYPHHPRSNPYHIATPSTPHTVCQMNEALEMEIEKMKIRMEDHINASEQVLKA